MNMKRLFLAGAAILTMQLIAGGPAAGQAAPSAAASVDVAPFVAHQVHPKVHLLSTPEEWYAAAIGNVTLIEQSDGFVVIDSGFNAANGRAVVRYAKSLANKPIKAVLITHWHGDHPQGVSAIRDAYPKVRVITTRGTEAGLRGPAAYAIGYRPDAKFDRAFGNLTEQNKAGYQKLLDDPTTAPDRKERIRKALGQLESVNRDFAGSYLVLPTETFERELVINDREIPVRLMYLGRANTEGDAIAWLPKQRIVVTGDIVVSPYPFGFGSFSGDWIETLGKIKKLGFTTLVPGHGMPQADGTYLDKLIAGLTDLRSQVFPLAKTGASLEEVKKKVDFTKSTALFGDTPRVKANLPALFFDPMTGSVFKEARGEPIVQGAGFPPPEVTDTPPPSAAKRHKS